MAQLIFRAHKRWMVPLLLIHSNKMHVQHRYAIGLWVLGLLLLVVASLLVFFHPAPWPFDLQTTITLQNLQLWSWVSTPIAWVSSVDNVLPSLISYIVWFVGLSLIGVVVWRRGGPPMPWLVTAIFVSLVPGVMNGLNGLIALLVSRPRPSSPLIYVYMPVPVHSFPSGHVENDVVYLGFLRQYTKMRYYTVFCMLP